MTCSLALIITAIGCQESASDEDAPLDPTSVVLVPVEGRVTVDGKPLEMAVVTFLPEEGGGSCIGETDADGRYTLETFGRKGAMIGPAKVAVSYLVSAEGEPQGLGPRSAMAQPPGMLSATERLAPEFSDLGRTSLEVEVSPQGGTFDFQVQFKPESPSTPETPPANPSDGSAETPGAIE